MTKVRVERKPGEQTYTIYNADTDEEIGKAANDLNLWLQCQAQNWHLVNPPKWKNIRRR